MTLWYAPNQQCVGIDVNRTANGATAGSPGTWTPAGEEAPWSLAKMAGIVASPATAWTTGQRMLLGDGTECTWSGTDWVGGRAPLAATTKAAKG